MMKKFLYLFVLLFITACSAEEIASSAPKAAEIRCTVAYRRAVTQPIESEETITFTDSDSEERLEFGDVVFHAAYVSQSLSNERSLRLWVTDSIENEQTLSSQLFQLETESGPQNQFVGGHGFTGLHYSYHPTSGSEMQYWCEV